MTATPIVAGISLLLSLATPIRAEPAAQAAPACPGKGEEEAAHITMIIGDKIITACLNDSRTSQDFIASLPATMKMTRWGEREYYGKVGAALSVEGQRQSGFANGDVAYWAPGGSFAIFFNETANQNISDLIVMGKITSNLETFDTLGESVVMRIETTR